MKRFIFIAAASVFAIPTLGADLPNAKRAAPSVLTPQVATSFAGFYAGVNGGYGRASDTRSDVQAGGGWWTPAGGGMGQTIKPSGWLAGLQVGYYHQIAPRLIFGVEAQGNLSDLNKTDKSAYNSTNAGNWSAKATSVVTATGRLGYTFGDAMPYIKGGYAGANLKSAMADSTGDALSHSEWRHGWTLGGGVDYALTSKIVVGVDYAYLGLGSQTWTGVSAGAGVTEALGQSLAERISDKLNISQVTARVNYKF